MESHETWTVGDVAAFLRISQRKLFYLRAQGMLPPAVRIGRSVRFRASEVRAWFTAGCPPLAKWEAIKAHDRLTF